MDLAELNRLLAAEGEKINIPIEVPIFDWTED